MKWKIWLNIATATALLLITYFAWEDIAAAFSRLGQFNLWMLCLAILVQLFVFLAQAKMFEVFFKVTTRPIALRELFPAMMELNFVNHVFPSGGVSGFSYLTLRLKLLGISTAKSALAQLARYAVCFVGYILLLLLALLFLALQDRTSALLVLVVSAVTFTILFGTGVLFFVVGSKQRIITFTSGLARFLNRLIHVFRRRHPETIRLRKVRATFLELHEDYLILRGNARRLVSFFVWAMVVNVAEVAVLYLVFVAQGVWVDPGAVIIAFVIANIAGFIAILPGGIGVYEPLMTAVLISAGVPAGLALSATLIFRVLTLIISFVTGYMLYQRVVHKYGKNGFTSRRTS